MTQQFMSEDISKLALALSKFQGSVGPIYKTKSAGNGSAYSYKYADLSEIMGTISKTLSECELSLSQILTEAEGERVIVTMLMHSSGQWIRGLAKIPEQKDIQGLGKAITYLRRYSLSSILGVAAEDNDNAQSIKDNEMVTKKPAGKVAASSPKAGKITEEQKETLADLAVQIDDLNLISQLCNQFRINNIEDVDSAGYQTVYNALMVKINSKGAPKYAAKSA